MHSAYFLLRKKTQNTAEQQENNKKNPIFCWEWVKIFKENSSGKNISMCFYKKKLPIYMQF